nr:sigma-70 family RNA polymerase sigma factor [Paenibacillus tritici]
MILCSKRIYLVDESVQKEIYLSFYKLTYNTVKKYIGNVHTIEDIIHDIFIQIIVTPPKYLNESQVISWILTVTRNYTFNFLRKQNKENEKVQPIEEECKLRAKSCDYEDFELADVIKKCLGQLNPQCEKVMILRAFYELSYKEIATLLNLTEGSVRQSIYRSRALLKKFYLEFIE